MLVYPWFAPQTYEIGRVFHRAYHGMAMQPKLLWRCCAGLHKNKSTDIFQNHV